MKALIMGDFHFPDRENVNFDELKRLSKLYFDYVILTGDYTSEYLLNFIEREFSYAEIYKVKGNCDDIDLKEIELFRIKGFNFVLYHGHKIYPRGDIRKLMDFLNKFGGDVLITGHTHKPLFYYENEKYIINPGSFTGAYSGEGDVNLKSYVILEIDDKRLIPKFINEFK